jgi:chromosome segregation ATPase
MLIRDLKEIIKNAPEWASITIDHVYFDGYDYVCEDIELKAKIQDLEGDVKGAESEINQLQKTEADLRDEIVALNDQIEKERALMRQIHNNETNLADEVKVNEDLHKEIEVYKTALHEHKRVNDELNREVTKLRARKNKATVKRCLTTGGLIAEYDGVIYKLIKE